MNPILNACGEEIQNDDRHIAMKEACLRVGVSKNTIYKMIDNNQFPPQHTITPGRVGFWESELNTWHKLGADGWYNMFGQHKKQSA